MRQTGESQDRHEVNTALAICRGAAEVLREQGADSGRWEEAADLLLGGLQRLDSIDLDVIEHTD